MQASLTKYKLNEQYKHRDIFQLNTIKNQNNRIKILKIIKYTKKHQTKTHKTQKTIKNINTKQC